MHLETHILTHLYFITKNNAQSNPKQPICCYLNIPHKNIMECPVTHSVQCFVFVCFLLLLNVFTISSKPRRTSEPFAILM